MQARLDASQPRECFVRRPSGLHSVGVAQWSNTRGSRDLTDVAMVQLSNFRIYPFHHTRPCFKIKPCPLSHG